jgi:uncharacterized membrane protein
MWERILAYVATIGSGLVAGEILAIAAAVMPAARTVPVQTYVRWHMSFAHHIDLYIPKVAVTTILAGAGLAYLQAWPGRILAVAGTVFMVLVAVISEAGNQPLNRKLAALGPETPAVEAERFLDRWRQVHHYRTVSILLSLAAFAAAATFVRDACP